LIIFAPEEAEIFKDYLFILARFSVRLKIEGGEYLCPLSVDQHAALDIYNASSLKQQPVGRHVAPLGHIIMGQLLFVLTP
jgi:hypothetical protein